MSNLAKKLQKETKKIALNQNLAEIISEEEIEVKKNRLYTSSYLIKDSWKNEKRNWGHSMHAMASRSGSFPPALASYFIERFSQEGDVVLDPFSGKGTTPLQACLNKRYGIGIDVAPEAYALTAAKTIKFNHIEAIDYLEKLELEEPTTKEIREVPKEVKIFYHQKVLRQILSLRNALSKDYSLRHVSYLESPKHELSQKNYKQVKFAQYWTGVLMGILHGSSDVSLSVPCSHSFSMAPNYVANYSKKHGLKKPNRDVKQCLITRSQKLQRDGALKQHGRAILGSAMDLPENLESTIDLIVTSPPYFTAQSYAWDNWLREWYLGFDFKDVRKQTLHTAVEDKYRIEMRKHLEEAYKVLKPGRWAFYVVGDVIKKVKAGKYKIITAELLAQEADEIGFDVELIINDDIPRTSCYNSSFLKEDQGLKLDRVLCLFKS